MMKVLKVCLIVVFASLWTMSGFAQDLSPLYPGMTLVQKKEGPSKATYKIKKWDRVFQMELTKTPTTIDVKFYGPKGNIIGTGKIGKEGTSGRKLILKKSAKGLVQFWHFAMDRVSINGGEFQLLSMQVEGDQLWTCQYCCYETYLQGVANADNAHVEEQIRQGKPPKEWGWIYDLPPSAAKEAYNNCVDACIAGGECSDYEW